MYVKDIMTKDVITVERDFTVEQCARLLSKNNISGAPVVGENGKVIGVVTEGDLIKRAADIKGPSYLEMLGGIVYFDTPQDILEEFRKAMGRIVGDIMTRDVVTVNEDKTVEQAATIMVKEKVKRLPVVDDVGNLVGVISRKDILHFLYDENE